MWAATLLNVVMCVINYRATARAGEVIKYAGEGGIYRLAWLQCKHELTDTMGFLKALEGTERTSYIIEKMKDFKPESEK